MQQQTSFYLKKNEVVLILFDLLGHDFFYHGLIHFFGNFLFKHVHSSSQRSNVLRKIFAISYGYSFETASDSSVMIITVIGIPDLTK